MLLIGAHYVLIVRLDASPIYLRAVSLLIPIPFGYALKTRERQGVWAAVVSGSIVSALGITGMLTTIAFLDNKTVMPADQREWQEALEYGLGIMLAFVTGNLLGRIGLWVRSWSDRGLQLDRESLAKRWDMLVTAAGAVATAVGSMMAALQGGE